MKSERVDMPSLRMMVSVPVGIDQFASTCIHDTAQRPMCTIIPLGACPRFAQGPWILSPWGNGPGIVCFLDDWDGKPFMDVRIVEIHNASVVGIPVKGV